MNSRELLRKEFTTRIGWGDAELFPLIPDASFRQYFRLVLSDRSAMLMDAPPEHESIEPFLVIAHHLQQIGLRVPEIFSYDVRNGFILLEDLGDETFTAQLDSGGSAFLLYEKAIIMLTELHDTPNAANIDIGKYDLNRMIDEACLFTRWYLPAVTGTHVSGKCEKTYIAVWESIFNALPKLDSTLVLRDYHVDNLMMVDNQCAVLDFQDALIGSPAYDVVSLLEDARRDLDDNLIINILGTYFSHRSNVDRKAFYHHYRVWGAQRHCKVAGIFMRLWLRDNKPHYLEHLSRVIALLRKNLEYPALEPLSQWFTDNDFNVGYQKPVDNRGQILSRITG